MADEKAKKKGPEIPVWAGRHPFEPHEKRPIVLRPEDGLPRFYGTPPHKIGTYLFLSTNRLSATQFSVPPGGYFEPYDIHGGDEVYYVLCGSALVFNPETGQTYRAEAGDIFYIPLGTWHQTYNVGREMLTIIPAFAPKMWTDNLGTEVVFKGTARFYKGKEFDASDYPKQAEPAALAGPDEGRLGAYPLDGATARARKQMFNVPAHRTLNVVHGSTNHFMVSFHVSNDFLHSGTFALPGDFESDVESHKGDEVFYVLEGTVSVVVQDKSFNPKAVSVSRLEARTGDRCFIPEGTPHRYVNLGTEPATAYFTIAPEL